MPNNSLSFLGAVSLHLKAASAIKPILAVTPGRRVAAFLRKSLEDIDAANVTVVPMDTFVKRLTPLRQASRLEALAALQEAWNSSGLPSQRQDLERFLTWGDILLSDTEALLHQTELPRVLKEPLPQAFLLQRDPDNDSPAPDLDTLWRTLPSIMEAFTCTLGEKGLGTAAMLQRDALSRIKEDKGARFAKTQGQTLAFIHPNITSPLTETLLAEAGGNDALWYWNHAGEPLEDEHSPAVQYAKRYISRHPAPADFLAPARPLATQRWHVVHAASRAAQATTAAQILKEVAATTSPDDIAMVLPDDNLLLPALAAMPEAISDINVTMGYPVGGSAAADLPQLTYNLTRNRRDGCVHHKDIRAILLHPYVKLATEDRSRILEEEIRHAGRTRIPVADIAGREPVVDAFIKDGTPAAILREATRLLLPALPDHDAAILQHVTDATEALSEAIGDDSPAWHTLLSRSLKGERAPFEGIPIAGLQVMGPMEIHCLDFKTVIYLSADEGTLPATTKAASLLPEPLRLSLGLAPSNSLEMMSTLRFWRSTCRAEDIWLVHDASCGGMHSGEETRFVKQLALLYGTHPEEAWTAYPHTETPAASLSVEKTPEVIQELTSLFVGGKGAFSATSINTYLDCRLRFYLTHVKGIKESQDVIENLDAALFGTIYHTVMETTYKPLTGKTLERAAIHALRDERRLRECVTAAFAAEGIPQIEGGNTILADIIVNLADRTLAADEEEAPLTILGTEEPMNMYLSVPNAGRVRLYGLADRVDRPALAPAPRIVDYKTGSAEGKDGTSDIAAMFDRKAHKRPTIGLQLQLYALLADGGKDLRYDPCIYGAREIWKRQPRAKALDAATKEEFKQHLTMLLTEVFDPTVPFDQQGEDPGRCKNCPFRRGCGR